MEQRVAGQAARAVLFVAGEQDTIAGYEDGVLRLAREAVNAPRYLLAYQNARHNMSPNPPPAASYANREDFSAYAESAWDSARINNINQHVVTAFLEQTLRQRDMGHHLAPGSALAPARIGPGLTWRHWPAAAGKGRLGKRLSLDASLVHVYGKGLAACIMQPNQQGCLP